MGNPARELASLLTAWRTIPRGHGVYTVRGMDSQSVESWRTQVHAAGLLHDVDRFLTAMETAGYDVAHYQEFIPAWSRAIFVPDRHWGQGANGDEHVYDAPPVAMLRAAADLFDNTELTVTLSAERTNRSVSAIDEIAHSLADPNIALTGPERRYVFELLNSCRTVFQESELLGTVDLLRRVHELLGTLTMIAEALSGDPETVGIAKRLQKLAREVVPYLTFGAKLGAGFLGVGADTIQITDGIS
ncbi:MAG: hypothetical protein K0R99_4483 [Microbacterium sp.]|jgi:hypothetical protein|uniref:hypothetical protein n=1 Tax=Microbacterium sp. TaxID=51671 RepID=UPI0026061124|nr:hypothetical protein [Microbacterium sp.]MDF2563037.1 hypothetical protein [Microbacterium sp.]